MPYFIEEDAVVNESGNPFNGSEMDLSLRCCETPNYEPP